jgi:hypothetical protein
MLLITNSTPAHLSKDISTILCIKGLDVMLLDKREL